MKKMFIFVDFKLIHKMTITLDNTIEQLNIIKSVISNGLSYESYRQQILKDLQMATNEELNTPGSLPHYAHLNHARMNRLDKTIVLDEPTKTKLSQINNKYNWVLISEGWCGDASQIVPIISKMSDFSDKIDLKIILRDKHLDLMDVFLTNGARAIPKLIILNENFTEIIGTWGARPFGAQKLITDYKNEHKVIDQFIKTELQKWYLKDKGLSTMKEILTLLN